MLHEVGFKIVNSPNIAQKPINYIIKQSLATLPINEALNQHTNISAWKSTFLCLIRYSYITSTSRISLLLHETEGEARGRVLITMISYECL